MLLTPAQRKYVQAVQDLTGGHQRATVTAIAARLGVSKPTASDSLRRLVARGLIRRSEDGQYGGAFVPAGRCPTCGGPA